MYINGWEIIVNPEQKTEADFWIVYGNGRPNDKFKVPKNNTLLVVLEPKEKKIYPRNTTNNFTRLLILTKIPVTLELN